MAKEQALGQSLIRQEKRETGDNAACFPFPILIKMCCLANPFGQQRGIDRRRRTWLAVGEEGYEVNRAA